MPSRHISLCRKFLAQSYHDRLGVEFGQSISDVELGRCPVWRTVSCDDLTTESSDESEDTGGLILDPEIGVLAYLFPFLRGTALRKQITRALKLRSQLSTERNYTASSDAGHDTRGAWRIVLHWLVYEADRAQWTAQMMELRRDTAFTEELSLDAIFIGEGDFAKQLHEYGFPRLLLTTREVLRIHKHDEIVQWLSADSLVSESLMSFANLFRKDRQIRLANEVVGALAEFKSIPRVTQEEAKVPNRARSFNSIRIRNFRNLRDVDFTFGSAMVSANVIHGPNGTGKSSVCEALSCALFRSSHRYRNFVDRSREKDVSATDRSREYVNRYLTPIASGTLQPEIALDDEELRTLNLVPGERAIELDHEIHGTILTQDSSSEFARIGAQELASRVLRGYSDLADHIDDFVQVRFNQADSRRNDLLRKLGINVAVRRLDTAYEKISRRELDSSLPPPHYSVLNWLKASEAGEASGSGQLSELWRTWSDSARGDLALEMAEAHSQPTEMTSLVRTWVRDYNDLVRRLSERVELATSTLARAGTAEEVKSKISAWGEWIEGYSNKVAKNNDALALKKALGELEDKQKALLEAGRTEAAHLEHLEKSEAFIREKWLERHREECPTCSSKHTGEGGILHVVEELRAKIGAERDRLRKAFSELKTEIDQLRVKLRELGESECPLNTDDRAILSDAFQRFTPGRANFGEWIGARPRREALLETVDSLFRVPEIPAIKEPDAFSQRLCEETLARFLEAEEVFELPSDWKTIKEKLTEKLAAIVTGHLPETLERLWSELALNLTAAPWLLPDKFRFEVVTRKGEKASTIRVDGRLARYVLNHAEIHTLGLAWFFTRYLTRGRFFHSCLVMDDPAHELDQTSFRDLCRLWETLMRLHRVYERPLKLIVMLNQENRAVEAARAMTGILSVLGWEREQKQSIKSISVIGEGFHPPLPTSVFGAATG